MKDYFLTVYYNYNSYSRRYELTKEFLKTYPYFWCIEVAYDDKPFVFEGPRIIHIRKYQSGFINNELINHFVALKTDLRSLTFVDSDCVLPDSFESVISNYYDRCQPYVPIFLQPYSTTNMLYKSKHRVGKIYNGRVFNEFYGHDVIGHTGLAYSYNKQFLDLVGKFPEMLILGGFDTILYASLFQDHITIEKLSDISRISGLMDYYNKVGLAMPLIDCLNFHISTHEHGLQLNRKYNERWLYYRNISQKVVDYYFRQRKEDQTLL